MKIIGVKIVKRKIIKNKKGNIFKYISSHDSFIKKFGEVYINELKKGKTKGWNLHKKNKCYLIVILGSINFHLIDGRKKSRSYNREMKLNLSKAPFRLLIIPPGVWFSFFAPKKDSSIINFLEVVHTDKETQKSEKIKSYLIKN